VNLEINRSEELDRWRFTCPNGHHSYDPSAELIYCHACERIGRSSTHDTLTDRKTGETLTVRDIDILHG
jgi:hypothetical protein